MQATFGTDGEVKAKGKGAAPAVAEGLGASNIKGVDDEKTKIDIAHEPGHPIVHETPITGRGPKPAYDPGSGVQTIAEPGTIAEGDTVAHEPNK
ncbi:hypothetical protein COCSUDRAFT_61133 [Coccomyxa subellipsoidea C-169]|uniref:Uncharacterized protein n=1 Tax=Coccomyxa subellipsoidea (strain C-169) TaxID=574566 RepID=I0Z674_COCSC|nr:hypothetical protein COCSUDRAFT_61133 [Coccomyxa subellipsoidea C-169]EIE26143.1 hypothetical protein COCSUDRAFT_61133 [Coccomyxa subellipsoidea C-169]|eukprot:XP_005650687.1 hypothetical protein COCSUDRAFT_61133 [Coccomyxa subellipsoidea C-169]